MTPAIVVGVVLVVIVSCMAASKAEAKGYRYWSAWGLCMMLPLLGPVITLLMPDRKRGQS